MKWTTTPPTEPGWYWLKEWDRKPNAVLVLGPTTHAEKGYEIGVPYLRNHESSTIHNAHSKWSQWAGPISTPEDSE